MTKKLIQTAAGVLFLLGMTGCVDMQTTVIVKKDGSGYVVDSFYLGKQAAGMMAMGQQANPDQKNPMSPSDEDLKARAAELGADVKLMSSKEVSKPDGSAGYKATYSFPDISKIKLTMPNDQKPQGGPGNNEAEKEEEPPITFAYNEGNLTIKIPQGDKDFKPKQMTAEEKQQAQMGLSMMKGMMQGMRMRMMVKVDGEITESNASHLMKGQKSGKNQYIVLADIDFNQMDDDALIKMMSSEGASPAEASAMMKDAKGVKMETAETVKVKFK